MVQVQFGHAEHPVNSFLVYLLTFVTPRAPHLGHILGTGVAAAAAFSLAAFFFFAAVAFFLRVVSHVEHTNPFGHK